MKNRNIINIDLDGTLSDYLNVEEEKRRIKQSERQIKIDNLLSDETEVKDVKGNS